MQHPSLVGRVPLFIHTLWVAVPAWSSARQAQGPKVCCHRKRCRANLIEVEPGHVDVNATSTRKHFCMNVTWSFFKSASVSQVASE